MPAIFGVLYGQPTTAENGLSTRAIGIEHVTECAGTSKMPSINVLWGFPTVNMGDAIFAFGGYLDNTPGHATPAVYKYHIATNVWTQEHDLLNQRAVSTAVQLSETEIIVAGKISLFQFRGLFKFPPDDTTRGEIIAKQNCFDWKELQLPSIKIE